MSTSETLVSNWSKAAMRELDQADREVPGSLAEVMHLTRARTLRSCAKQLAEVLHAVSTTRIHERPGNAR